MYKCVRGCKTYSSTLDEEDVVRKVTLNRKGLETSLKLFDLTSTTGMTLVFGECVLGFAL